MTIGDRAGTERTRTITVQLNDVVKLCWSGVAHFSDNHIQTEPEKCA